MNKITSIPSGRIIYCRRQQIIKIYRHAKKKIKKTSIYDTKSVHKYYTLGANSILSCSIMMKKRRFNWRIETARCLY